MGWLNADDARRYRALHDATCCCLRHRGAADLRVPVPEHWAGSCCSFAHSFFGATPLWPLMLQSRAVAAIAGWGHRGV